MLLLTRSVDPTEENLSACIHSVVTCVEMRSNLFPADVVKSENWEAISAKCKESLGYIAKARK